MDNHNSNKFSPFLPLPFFFFIIITPFAFDSVHCEYSYSSETTDSERFSLKETITHLHFYYFDVHTGQNPTSVVVARANGTHTPSSSSSSSPFGTVYAIDNLLRAGPEESSDVIGNARGLCVSSSREDNELTLTMHVDYAFTGGDFRGSSFVVASRNPVRERERELAVVGGRGKFRMARGFAVIKNYVVNGGGGTTSGDDGVVEYDVTLIHYHSQSL